MILLVLNLKIQIVKEEKIYDMIKAGLNVIDIEGWGKESDNILFRCKILVNVHFHDKL